MRRLGRIDGSSMVNGFLSRRELDSYKEEGSISEREKG